MYLSPSTTYEFKVSARDGYGNTAQILDEVYLNGERFDDGVIGYGSTVTYCRAEGPTEIVLRAVDTSGNVSASSNQLLFSC